MAAAIQLRGDHTADDLRRLAKASRDAKQTRRLLALAAIYEGSSRSDAARIGGVGLQIIRDWVLRFNAEGPAGLIDRKAVRAVVARGRRRRVGAAGDPARQPAAIPRVCASMREMMFPDAGGACL